MTSRRLLTVLALLGVPGLGIAALVSIVDFDDLKAGTLVQTVEDIDFSFNSPDANLVVSSGLATTSEPHYLGATEGVRDPFLPGDVISLKFASPIVDLSLVVLSTAGTPSGVFELSTSSGSDVSGMPDAMLEGDEVYGLSVRSQTPFSSAELRAAPEGLYAFHLDDVAIAMVPEPPETMIWLCVALGMIASRYRRWTAGSR